MIRHETMNEQYELHKAKSYRCQAEAHRWEAEAVRFDVYEPERRAERIAHHEEMERYFTNMAAIAEAAAEREAA